MRILYILAIIFIAYQVVFRLLIPYFIGKTIRKTQERMFNYGQNQQTERRREGEVRVEFDPSKTKTNSRDIDGEYVDYTEVK
jgi:hypothetical protein